ncbi:DNA-directed RNA polymerase I subunit RPA43 [Petaurus breviceps papuanus]|uniref:DNA-directed RNA polymerase I subunit RPA43 n=1 Tax=Petaurus breviceps papuanus TaxID=3040969 RepID=UPI0036DAFA06
MRFRPPCRGAARCPPASLPLSPQGTVNKVAPSHVGCLVHGCFNASIPKPEHMAPEQWQSLRFQVGDQLEFQVSRLDSDAAGVFCIRGKLLVDSLPPACPLPKGSGDIGDESEPGVGGEKPKKKRRKILKQSQGDGGPTPMPADGSSDTAGVSEAGPRAQEAVNGLCEEQEPRTKEKLPPAKLDQDPLWHASDSSGYQSDRQTKKRKRTKQSDEPEGPVTPKELRPRKKKREKE